MVIGIHNLRILQLLQGRNNFVTKSHRGIYNQYSTIGTRLYIFSIISVATAETTKRSLVVTSVSHLPQGLRESRFVKTIGRGGEGSFFLFSYRRLSRYWPQRKRPKWRFFGDDKADWLEVGEKLVSQLEVGEKIGLPFQFFVWLRPNFEIRKVPVKFNHITFRFRPGNQTISQNEAKDKTFLVKMSFICNCVRLRNHFHINSFALSLAFKQRLAETRKWAIKTHRKISVIGKIQLVVYYQC